MTATQPTSTVPAWRVAVIALVGLLAVGIGLVAGAAMLNTRAALIGSGASYVPASAPVYFELRLQPSDAQDASLRELLGRFPEIEGLDLARPLYDQLTEKIDEAAGSAMADLSWSGDVATWFDGRVGFAMLDFPAEAMTDPAAMPAVPSMVVTLGVTDRAEAEAAIGRLLEQAPEMQLDSETYAGATLYSQDGAFAYTLTDDQLLFSPAVADLRAALDAHASADTTLSEAGSIASLTDALPDDWLAFAYFDLTDVMGAALDSGAAPSPGGGAFRELMANQSLRGAMAVTAGGDRMSMMTVSDPPTGPLTVQNTDRGLADEVPGDAIYYAEAGNVGESLRAMIGPVKDSFAAMPGAAEQLEMVEGALGADLEELIAWMGDTATVAGWDGEQPYGGLVSVPTDMAEAERRLGQIATFAGLAAMDPASGVSVDEREVDGATVTTLRVSTGMIAPIPGAGGADAPSEVVLEWTVTEDRAVIAIGDRFVERVLTLDAADSLAGVERYADAVADMGGATNAGVTWLDVRGARTAIEDAMGSMDPAAMDMYVEMVQPWLEPLDRIVAVARLDGEILRSDVALLVD